MRWLFNSRRLRDRGILGMNRRNAEFILDANSPKAVALADDKLQLHRLCVALGVPTPAIFTVIDKLADARRIPDLLVGRDDCVIKPARGLAGRGVLVLTHRQGFAFRAANDQIMTRLELRDHVAEILSGSFSLGGRADVALLQERIRVHPVFEPIAAGGVPDVRVIVFRGEPAMAMLRLPTRASAGRANLHQGGLGVGIDLEAGITCHAATANRPMRRHPDTGADLIGRPVPDWPLALELSRRAAAAIGLRFLGVDLVLDPRHGWLVLEVNARPGLTIQNANSRGLLARLRSIDLKFNPQPGPYAVIPSQARNLPGALRSE
jgi:alpha-L-glutamate ligase-like protein